MPRTDELKKWIIKEDVQIEHSHYLKLLKGTIVIAKDRPILLDELGLEIPEKLYWQLVEELDNEDITLDDLADSISLFDIIKLSYATKNKSIIEKVIEVLQERIKQLEIKYHVKR